jgi:hypothetical protein
LQLAWSMIRQKGPRPIYIFTGSSHGRPLAADGLEFLDDKIGPALRLGRLKLLTLDHLGRSPDRHDVAVFNRLTGATMATHLNAHQTGAIS